MSTNPLNDISKVYLEQVASQEVEEGYQPIGREKESAMYRRAGNLARTSLASKGKEKLAAAKKSATIVGAITRQKEKERFDSIGQSPSHNEEAKPDFLDFDKDGNKKESMKKALKDKAKQKMEEAKKPNDGNLANNYPPYDKVTRGDVIAGRLGKDEMGGKKKTVKEGYSNWREDLREVMSSVEKKDNDVKITEKKVENKIKTSAMGGGITLPEAIKNLGGTLLEMEEIDEKTLTTAETKKKEEIVKSMKDKEADFEKRYPGRGKEVMYATATKMAKKVAEQAMEVQPKTQPQKPQNTAAINQVLLAKQQADTAQKNLAVKQRMAAQKGVNLSSLTSGYEPEGEVIDERRKEDKVAGTPRKPRNPAFELVAKSMGTSRMGVKPRGVKKEKGAPTPGPNVTPAQKVAKRRADAQRAQELMHSPRD